MSKMIQVRNVSERLHRELVRRARLSGLTLTGYIAAVLEREASRPPRHEVFQRLSRSQPVHLGRPAADLIAEERSRR